RQDLPLRRSAPTSSTFRAGLQGDLGHAVQLQALIRWTYEQSFAAALTSRKAVFAGRIQEEGQPVDGDPAFAGPARRPRSAGGRKKLAEDHPIERPVHDAVNEHYEARPRVFAS
ncbi:hypothetical protein, partial [Lichenifustis flavocetrariae]